ncbi:hypothetical protein Tco_0354681, partial [Tanacetum coccineum]
LYSRRHCVVMISMKFHLVLPPWRGVTYLKHVGNKKHSDLKSKTFEEIQALYEKVKRFDESFTAVSFTEDERRIKEMNKGVKDTDQKRLKEEDIAQVPAKVEVT